MDWFKSLCTFTVGRDVKLASQIRVCQIYEQYEWESMDGKYHMDGWMVNAKILDCHTHKNKRQTCEILIFKITGFNWIYFKM